MQSIILMYPAQSNPNDSSSHSSAALKRRAQEYLKDQLRSRLYDKGVSNRRLPGIVPPDSSRPCTVKPSSKAKRKETLPSTSSRFKLQPIATHSNLMQPPDETTQTRREQEADTRRRRNVSNNASSSVLRSITGITVRQR
eukprot:TRINITY_DN15476_c0_g1_i2.p1 TRINITY_DN15476_c0_g1~~TRINITY_DN15476_c0_g1_i2.p1  ORF type:complete len:149 (+),score=28.65 TRINITY_DN15476_c0_g1_i2:30-449(+)